MKRRNLTDNTLSGSLPSNWAYGDVFPQLQVVTLDRNRLSGSLPPDYTKGLMSLTLLNLDSNNFSGEPPPSAQRTLHSACLTCAPHHYISGGAVTLVCLV